MNLPSMMYRLNVQQPQQSQSQQQQQQQQQPLQQQQSQSAPLTSSQSQLQSQPQQPAAQLIPSHILLQQQLNAAAAAAAAAAVVAGATTSNPAISLHAVAASTSAATTHGGISDGVGCNEGSDLTTSGNQHQHHHHQQQQQQQQQHHNHNHQHLQQHPHHHQHHHHHHHHAHTQRHSQNVNTSSNSSNISAAATTVSSVEDKIKLLPTAIKSEPLHDVIALTKVNNNNNNNSSSSSSNIISSNIIALSVNATAAAAAANANANANATVTAPPSTITTISSGSGKKSASTSVTATATATATSALASASATTCGNHLNNASTINLVVGAGGNSGPNATASTSGGSGSGSGSGSGNSSSSVVIAASGSGSVAGGSNGHLVFVPSKRARLEGPEEWISTPSPGSVPSSAPPLSPSPGSQNHSYSANMSNGYASPMSAGSYDPYSPNGKTGRDDLSPSSSLNGYSTNEGCDAKKSKKGPAPRLQEELCLVCGDRASGYHYNALTCEGCKGFFRRSVTKNAMYCCKFGRACEMDMYMRRKCQECRLKKCLAVGMRPECVVPENQCAMKRREKKAQKEKDKQQASPSSAVSTTDSIKKEILELMTCEPPTHQTCPLLPEDILAKCHARNIPQLTYNQLAVIYKLIWYQDGYEQPSEEDLKRIMVSSPDENESQHDTSFRHITEITILTVQLIVEFAKGLPAFTKIPQEDQITLLKACSSEVMMLRMARRYDHVTDSIFFANNRSYTRDAYKMAGVADNIEDLLHFCRQMYAMKVDNVEYALVTAIVIFSDRPGLEEAELVEAIQSYYIDTLRIYILNRHCGDPMSLVFFAKLLSILTELRTLGNQNAEMCFSLKLKNRKLPKFLEEIWDVHAVPPSVQSHIQATQADRATQEAIAASTSSAAAAAAAAAASISSSSTTISVVGGGGGGGGVIGIGASSSSVYSASSASSAIASTSGLNGGIMGGVGSVGSATTTSIYGPPSSTSMSMMGVGVPMKQEHMLTGENSAA